jgi:uncharacterized membrane protein YphA (DoxX/SURF4 family)
MVARSNEHALRVTGVGHAVLAVSVAGLGAMLLSGTFVYVWAPIPVWVPGRSVLACASGVLMLAAAAGLLWRKTQLQASAVATLTFLCWFLLLQVPRLAHAPSRELLWSGAAQLVSVIAGAWILFATLTPPTEGQSRAFRGDRAVRIARRLYAVALPMFGLHHFFDLAGAAEAVPAWLPFGIGWASLTGVGHVAAGIGIAFGIVPRLAARLEAIMIAVFVLVVHVPGVIGAPRDGLQWSMLLVASVIDGAAWIVARSYVGPRVLGAEAPGPHGGHAER